MDLIWSVVMFGVGLGNVVASAFRAGFLRREALLFEWRWET
jgi:hypothetical protein